MVYSRSLSFLSMDLDSSFGALFVGFTCSVFTLGILSAQAYTYFLRYPFDRPVYKWLVGTVFVLETLHSALNAHTVYIYTISNWGNPLIIFKPPIWSIVAQVPLSALVGSIVRGCYATRVWRFSSHNYWLTGTIIIGNAAQFGSALWYTVLGFRVKHMVDGGSIRGAANVAFALATCTDILSTVALCWYLSKLKIAYQQSNGIVNRLILYAINAGVLTSTTSLTCLITYDTKPGTLIYVGIYFVMSKLYANSLLATLNTRYNLKGSGTNYDSETTPTFQLVGRSINQSPLTGGSEYTGDNKASPSFRVDVHHEVSVKSDPAPQDSTKHEIEYGAV